MDSFSREAKRFEIENSCRTCMKSGCPLRSIFEKAFEEISFANVISAICSQSNQMTTDGLSKKICFRCQEAAIVCWEFHETVLNSERKMLELIKSNEELNEVLIADDIADGMVEDTDHEIDEASEYEFLFDEVTEAATMTQDQDSIRDLHEQDRFEYDDKYDETTFSETQQIFMNGIDNDTLSDTDDFECHASLHSQLKEDLFTCEVCSENFASSVHLSFHHSQNHETIESLNETSETNEFSSKLKKEKRSYRKDTQGRFICHICQRTYSSRDILTRHIVKHTSTKDFKCNFCPREFFFQRDLNVHLKQQHFDPKKFKCEICSAEFTTNASKKKHLSMHSEKVKRKFGCDKCPLSFKTKGVLQNHSKTHTGLKPFVCSICPNGAAFTQKIILQRHMKNVHHENIYKCEWCNQSFEMHGQLREHWKECTNLRSRGNYEIVIVSNDIVTNYDYQNESAVRSIEVDFDED